MTRLLFLRHADTHKDSSLPSTEWILSELGVSQAVDLSEDARFDSVEVIYVSEERKTMLTVEHLAKRLGRIPECDTAFDEVRRGDTFVPSEKFEAEKRRQLLDLGYHAFGGESGHEAFERFKCGVERAMHAHPTSTVLIATHGTILNIYFAELIGAMDELPERWAATPFCALGIVEDGAVLRDIIVR